MNVQLYLIVILCACVAAIACLPASYKKMKEEYADRLKLDISLDQMLEMEGRLTSFLRENNLEVGVELSTIAKVLGIVEDGEECYRPNRATLGDRKDDGTMPVSFRSDLSALERRFDYAHECAHGINKDPVPATRPEGYNKPETEQLADYMAAAILMPLEEVYTFLTEQGYRQASSSQKAKMIRILCKRYRVTELIALRRVREVFLIKEGQTQN